jgi:hypothetical protein
METSICECAFGMAKHLAFEEVFRNGRAVDGDKPPFSVLLFRQRRKSLLDDVPCQYLLADPSFTRYEYSGPLARSLCGSVKEIRRHDGLLLGRVLGEQRGEAPTVVAKRLKYRAVERPRLFVIRNTSAE